MTVRSLSAGRTEIGKVRKHNEDAILLRDDAGLWVVADGLGGHAAGDIASAMVVDRLGRLPRTGGFLDFVADIEDALIRANADLRQLARDRNVDLVGSTVVLLVQDHDYSLCGWAGDSRAYCLDEQGLRQITRDHVHGGDDDVTAFAAGSGPRAGAAVLTRALGAEDDFSLDWVCVERRPGLRYLLCSDGVNKEIDDRELAAESARIGDPHALVERVFDLALSRAARDNISAIVVAL